MASTYCLATMEQGIESRSFFLVPGFSADAWLDALYTEMENFLTTNLESITITMGEKMLCIFKIPE